MDNYKLIVNNVDIPISEKVASSIALNLSVADINEPEKRKADFSKDFELPSSKELNKEFAHAFEIDVDLNDTSFNPAKKVDCELIVNGATMIDGYIRLRKINKVGVGDYLYKVNIFGRLANLFNGIGDGDISEIDFSDLDHDYTSTLIGKSWDQAYILNGVPVSFALGSGYVYPMIDYGYDNDEAVYHATHFKPAIWKREYLLRIFNEAGYTWNSAFLDSTYFKSQIVPFSGGDLGLTADQIDDRKAVGQYLGPTPYVLPISQGLQLDIDNLPFATVQDTLGQISGATFVVDQTGDYDITLEGNYNAEFTHPAPGTAVTLNGYVNILQRIIVQGVVVLSKIIRIQADGSFTADYTTDINSAPDNPEYINQAGVIPVNVMSNPSSTLIGTRPNFRLTAGDVVEYDILTYFVEDTAAGVNPQGNLFQQVADPTIYYNAPTAATLNIQALDMRLVAVNTGIFEGNLMEMNTTLPKDVTKKDFLTSIIRENNLFVEPDKDNPTVLNIEPRDDYYSSVVVDWTEKLDLSKVIEYNMIASNKYKRFVFTNEGDSDYYNDLYNNSYNEVYGSRVIDVDNDFVTGTKTVKTIFASTPSVGSQQHDRVIPEIFKTDSSNNKVVFEGKIRSLYYGGLKATNVAWTMESDLLADQVLTTYPYAGHFDDPYTPTVDLNWGLPKEIYYSDLHQPITITNQGLYNRYYYKSINEATDANSRTVTAYFNLNRFDVETLDFSKLYRFDRAYFRLQQVVDYRVVGHQVTKCVFSLTDDLPAFVGETIEGNGGKGSIGGEGSPKTTTAQTNKAKNNYKSSTVDVTGYNNFIDPNAKNVHIIGDNNEVFGNVSNVTIIGSGHTVTKSNTVIIDGDVQIVDTNCSSTGPEFISASQTVEPGVWYIVDTSSGDVNLDMKGTDFCVNQSFKVTKSDPLNEVVLEPSGGPLINGEATKEIRLENTTVEVMFDGANFRIV